MIGKYIEVYYPEVEIVKYSSSKKYSSNFWARVLVSTRVLAAALLQIIVLVDIACRHSPHSV